MSRNLHSTIDHKALKCQHAKGEPRKAPEVFHARFSLRLDGNMPPSQEIGNTRFDVIKQVRDDLIAVNFFSGPTEYFQKECLRLLPRYGSPNRH